MTICIKNLRLRTILGVHEKERRNKREIVVNLEMEYDASTALRSDSITDALDYKTIRDCVVAAAADTNFRLIEVLVAKVMSELIRDARATRIDLEIEKPNALRLVDGVSVRASWKRDVKSSPQDSVPHEIC